MKSCLTLIVVIALGIFVYQLYRKSQEPISTEVQGEYGSDTRRSVLGAIDPLLAQRPNIQRVSLDGSVLDLQYNRDQSTDQFRQDAIVFAERFSQQKFDLTNDGNVTVRCIYENRIRVEAQASNGRVMTVEER